MRHRLLLVALAGVLALSACSSENDDNAATSTTATAGSTASSATASAAPTEDEMPASQSATSETAASNEVVVEVTIKGGKVDPAGDRVKATVGEPITFIITSDAPGELHVHSTPEHSIDIEPGTTRQSMTIDQPGVVEAELHDPAVVVVQLEVR